MCEFFKNQLKVWFFKERFIAFAWSFSHLFIPLYFRYVIRKMLFFLFIVLFGMIPKKTIFHIHPCFICTGYILVFLAQGVICLSTLRSLFKHTTQSPFAPFRIVCSFLFNLFSETEPEAVLCISKKCISIIHYLHKNTLKILLVSADLL